MITQPGTIGYTFQDHKSKAADYESFAAKQHLIDTLPRRTSWIPFGGPLLLIMVGVTGMILQALNFI